MTKFHKILIKNGAIWPIIELEEDIMVLNNLTRFHKILIKSIRFRERTLSGQTYVSTDGRTGVTLYTRAIIMVGA